MMVVQWVGSLAARCVVLLLAMLSKHGWQCEEVAVAVEEIGFADGVSEGAAVDGWCRDNGTVACDGRIA